MSFSSSSADVRLVTFPEFYTNGEVVFTVRRDNFPVGSEKPFNRNHTDKNGNTLDRARKQKKTLGRPRRILDRNKALTLRHQGKSLREIATELGIGKDTVRAVFAH
jgi:hypothetical protein